MFLPLQAEIVRVPTDAPSIRAGIDSTAKGDTVLVAEGTYFIEHLFQREENHSCQSLYLGRRQHSHFKYGD